MKTTRFFSIVLTVMFLAILFVNTAFSECTTLIVGKDASVDGSVLFAHNEDLSSDTAQTIEVHPRVSFKPGEVMISELGMEIPQVEMTNKYIQFNSDYNNLTEARVPYNADNPNGFNEWQVVTGDNADQCRVELTEAYPSHYKLEEGVTSAELKRLVAERAKSARDAVEIMGGLIETYGFAKDGGGGMMYSIADANEGWVVEAYVGKQWAAVRCPDNAMLVRANSGRIGDMDLKDTANFLGSKDLVTFATEKGWYNPKTDGKFNYMKVYGLPKNNAAASNRLRELNLVNYFSPSKKMASIDDELPENMIIIPDRKISKEDLMAWERSHYEGTEYDLSEGYTKGDPHHTTNRVICVTSTQSSTVAQMRNWLPNEIGGVLWVSESYPCASVYQPWYLGITGSPDVYLGATDKFDTEKAFWRFEEIGILANANYAELIKIIKPVWEDQEKTEFALQESIEKTALELYQKGADFASSYLTNYSNSWAMTSYEKTVMLKKAILTNLAQKGK